MIQNNARSEDGKPIGWIAAEDNYSILVLSILFLEYRASKLHAKSFNGTQLYLEFSFAELNRQSAAALYFSKKGKRLFCLF